MQPRSVGEALELADRERAARDGEVAPDAVDDVLRDVAVDDRVASADADAVDDVVHVDVPNEDQVVVPAGDDAEALLKPPGGMLGEVRAFLAGEPGDVAEAVVDDQVVFDEADLDDAPHSTSEVLVDDGPSEPGADDVVGLDELELEDQEPSFGHAPTMRDLRELLLSEEFAASVPPPPELGPWTTWGERRVPAVLLEMVRRGIIKDWR